MDLFQLSELYLPLYSIDLEKENGIPAEVVAFYDRIQHSDLILISLAEHNGSYTAAFKNLFDWLSRYESKFFQGKKLFLLSTSTGKRGGLSVMEAALDRFPRHGAEIVAHFSLPSFHDHFSEQEGIRDAALKDEFEKLREGVADQSGMKQQGA